MFPLLRLQESYMKGLFANQFLHSLPYPTRIALHDGDCPFFGATNLADGAIRGIAEERVSLRL